MPQIPAPASAEKRAPGRLGGEKVPQPGLSLEDLILEDNVGLSRTSGCGSSWWRHGLDGGEPRTLQEVAEKLATTRDHARRLQRKAHDRLSRESNHLARLFAGAS